jgi:hypothetical protein
MLLMLLPMPALLALGGCFGGAPRCEDAARYANSDSIAPLRIPDDLTVPDESETLLIPGGTGFGDRNEEPVQGCLESPPSFFQNDGQDRPSA